MLRNNYFLHFAADLKRVTFCLMNNNADGAKTFLEHANVIYLKHLKGDEQSKVISLDFDTAWFKIYNTEVPSDPVKVKLYSDELLTFTSMIFLRVINQQPLGKMRMDGQMKPMEQKTYVSDRLYTGEQRKTHTGRQK